MDIKYSFFGIISRSFKFFGKNFKELFGAMFMPVFLQGAGLLASLFPALYFTYIQKPTADMMMVFLLQLLLCLVFGLVLFCIGFWRYILLSCYFCLAANDFDDDKGFYIQIYKNNINKRQGEYIKTLLWPALIMILIMLANIIAVYYFVSQKTIMGSLFAVLSFIVAFVVMYDACGVRRAAGKQAALLNKLVETPGLTGVQVSEKLVEVLGHTPVQVFVGALIGLVVGLIA